jgi:hypothetical protein
MNVLRKIACVTFVRFLLRTISKQSLKRAGWHIFKEDSIHSAGLQDGRWEIDITLSEYLNELDDLTGVPEKFKSHLQSEIRLLKSYAEHENIKSMSTYAWIAE